jgi:hypothetical protein
MRDRLKLSVLVLAVLFTGMLSVRVSSGQTIQRNIASTTVGPAMTSAPEPFTISPQPITISTWSWSWNRQPQIQPQQGPLRTYWTNPNPNRIFPRLTPEAVATFCRCMKND